MKSKPLKKANHFPVKLMGCGFVITAIHEDAQIAWDAIRAGVKEIESATDGRVKFKIYPGGVQGDDQTVLRKMRIGQLHGGALAAGSLTRFFPDLQIYNLPLQFQSYEEVDYIRKEMDQMIADGLAEAGIVTFAFSETGFAYLLTQEPVRTVADLKGLKAWIPDNDPIAAELIKSLVKIELPASWRQLAWVFPPPGRGTSLPGKPQCQWRMTHRKCSHTNRRPRY